MGHEWNEMFSSAEAAFGGRRARPDPPATDERVSTDPVDLLRRAATKLRDPMLCNWDRDVALALAEHLDAMALRYPMRPDGQRIVKSAERLAAAVLREPDPTGGA